MFYKEMGLTKNVVESTSLRITPPQKLFVNVSSTTGSFGKATSDFKK